MAAKKQLAAAVAPAEIEEAKIKSMAALMSLLRATMLEEKAGAGAAAIGDTGEEEKVEWLRSQSQLIGKDVEFDTPFGRRALTYADQTSSGQSLRYIEDYLVKEVLPFYGNTHTEDSHVGSKTTRLVHKAAHYVKRCMGAGRGDALLFCGAGTTAAIKRLQEVMGVAVPSVELRARVAALRAEERWVVFVGSYEHHSNLLSWRRSLAEVVEIGVDADGPVDVAALRRALVSPELADRPMLGSFSACSNVTGVVTDTRQIARVLHEHGAFACFDFAAR
jgi:selenocysteine lyase/cysteine desulfurase